MDGVGVVANQQRSVGRDTRGDAADIVSIHARAAARAQVGVRHPQLDRRGRAFYLESFVGRFECREHAGQHLHAAERRAAHQPQGSRLVREVVGEGRRVHVDADAHDDVAHAAAFGAGLGQDASDLSLPPVHGQQQIVRPLDPRVEPQGAKRHRHRPAGHQRDRWDFRRGTLRTQQQRHIQIGAGR